MNSWAVRPIRSCQHSAGSIQPTPFFISSVAAAWLSLCCWFLELPRQSVCLRASFFISPPRRPLLIAAGLMIFLQVVIAITGNYCFFNLLTIALCLVLIDDATLVRKYATVFDRRDSRQLSIFGAIVMIIVSLPINAWLIFNAFRPDA